MLKALWIPRNLIVFVYPEMLPSMHYNVGKAVVSRQPNSRYTFCVDKSELRFFS